MKISADRVLAIVALIVSSTSLGWQVYDAYLKRTEHISIQSAPPLNGPKGGWKAATNGQTTFQFYLSNNGEVPFNILEIEPSGLFVKLTPNLPRRLEPGETVVLKTKTYSVTRKGLEELDRELSIVESFSVSPLRIELRTSRGKYQFPLDIRQQLLNQLQFEEGVLNRR